MNTMRTDSLAAFLASTWRTRTLLGGFKGDSPLPLSLRSVQDMEPDVLHLFVHRYSRTSEEEINLDPRSSLLTVLCRSPFSKTPHPPCVRRYSKMSEEEIKLDRYAKFRKLGHFEEFPVLGGLWREARAERAEVRAPRAPWVDEKGSHTCRQLLSWQP